MTAPTTPHGRVRRRGPLALTTAGALALTLVTAGGAVAHDGTHAYESDYTPPPVADPGRATGAFTNVSRPRAHEVWLVDQSDSRTDGDAASDVFPSYGGRIHVFDGADLRADADRAVAEVVDLGGATAELCREQTGANPVRPHMLSFNTAHTHAVLAFVVSGHTVIYDAADREPVACFRSEASPTGRQAHASVPTPDDQYVIVANQNGKRVERIRTDYDAGVFTAEPAATLDLAAGTTPNGVPMQTPGNPLVRPDNAPICPFIPSSGFPAYVSLRGGGMFAVDPYATPIQVVAEYPATEVARDGCGFTEADGWVYGNGGSNPGNLSGWFVYRLPVGDRSTYRAQNPPSTPAVDLVDQDTRGPRDAHGMATVGTHYVWGFDRAAHVLQVYRADSARTVTTVNLRSPFSATPAPDIVAEAPDGAAVYAATRGPNPLSGAHAATGDAPGVLVVEVRKGGRDGAVRGLAPVSNLRAGVERADPHGLAVRRTG